MNVEWCCLCEEQIQYQTIVEEKTHMNDSLQCFHLQTWFLQVHQSPNKKKVIFPTAFLYLLHIYMYKLIIKNVFFFTI